MKFIYLITLIALFNACASKEAEFEKSSGKTNKFKVGERFKINLAEDHTKDGLWSIGNTHDKNVIEYVNSIFQSNEGGSVDFNFEAKAKGKTEIQLNKSMALDTMQKVNFVIEIE
ncbi:MAG: hypothetical protein ACOVLD_03715 [Bacteroidia bacterium]